MVSQSYIGRALTAHSIAIPRELQREDFDALLSEIGFERPAESVFERYVEALNRRYPSRLVIPFAKAISSDDTAGIVVQDGRVIEFHDFAEQGFEQPKYFLDIASWLAAHRTTA